MCLGISSSITVQSLDCKSIASPIEVHGVDMIGGDSRNQTRKVRLVVAACNFDLILLDVFVSVQLDKVSYAIVGLSLHIGLEQWTAQTTKLTWFKQIDDNYVVN